MNTSRYRSDWNVQHSRRDYSLVTKIKKLPIIPKACLYVCLMGGIGAGMGEVKAQIESKDCMNNDQCWVVEPAQRRIREVTIGALLGMGTAALISLPALLENK